MTICYLIRVGQTIGHGADFIAARDGTIITVRNRNTGNDFQCHVRQQWDGEVAYLGFNSLMIDAGPHGLRYLCPA